MRKIIVSMLILVMLLFPSSVMAEGYISSSVKTLTIEEGSSKTFVITAYNAVGDVTIKSEDTSIATVSTGFFETGSIGDGQTKKGTITVKGKSIGTTKIKLDVDGATFDGVSLSDNDQEIVVNVIEKKIDTRSKNNKIKSIGVLDHELTKINDNNYTLTVSNSVTSIKVTAEAEDEKAKVSGVGIYDLKVGENNISVTVTAENGSKNKINIKVIRKDGYYLDDLAGLLKNNNDNIDIILTGDMKIGKEVISNIKDSGKIVTFNYYDKEKKLSYSFIVDGSKIGHGMEINMSIKNLPSDDKIYELVNYAEGLYVSILQEINIENGLKLSVNVSDKYSNGDRLNIYNYNGKKMELIGNNLEVKEGKIEFNLLKGKDYFITKSILDVSNSVTKGINIYMIISFVELIIILILIMLLLKKKRVNKKEVIFETETNIFPM